MKRLVDKDTGGVMDVPDSRAAHYMSAGHKPVAEERPAPEKKARKKE